ncbi:MAG TPA: hypothetical protein VFY87_08160 [Geminicoccaceae bacterium]|nr:hypothetical protein [Geminicoccaceae bacterium]
MVNAAAVTPGGRHAVSGGQDRALKVWDLVSGQKLATLVADHPVQKVAVASDRLFVAGDSGGAVHIVELIEPNAGNGIA